MIARITRDRVEIYQDIRHALCKGLDAFQEATAKLVDLAGKVNPCATEQIMAELEGAIKRMSEEAHRLCDELEGADE